MKNLEKIFSDVIQLAQMQAQSQQQLNTAIVQLAQQITIQPSIPTTQPAYVPASIVPDIPTPKQPKKVISSQFPARIMAIKPCSTCSLTNCPQNNKRGILSECGAEVADMKEAALFTGQVVVEVILKDKMGYPVYKDGKMIGVVPRINDTKKIIRELEEYEGKSVRVRTTVDTKKMIDRTNVYTNCFFEILGEMDSAPIQQTPPPAEPAYDLPEPVEPSTLQLGEIEIPEYY